ncbi:MAG: hypothetical protein QE267_09625 [Akkermansiaceae bacterium]|nr:hypothetical protein [Akkermansiaceae bacterium]
MNHNTTPTDDSWESDAVWKLLDQAPTVTPSARFIDNTVRAARLSHDVRPWWSRLLSPAPLAGLATATAALTFAVMSLSGPSATSQTRVTKVESAQAVAIQDIADAETLSAAVDHMDKFSDNELVSLIGF